MFKIDEVNVQAEHEFQLILLSVSLRHTRTLYYANTSHGQVGLRPDSLGTVGQYEGKVCDEQV